MARQSPINWKRSDYGNLLKAVNRFNKEIENNWGNYYNERID